jgi:malate dehydrogenase (oxaloacetate-decarboxylating)(NADP+)
VRDVIGLREGAKNMAALSLLVMPTRALFIADTYVNADPIPRRWPRSRCSPPTRCCASASSPRWRCFRIRTSAAPTRLGAEDGGCGLILHERAPTLEVDGEMHGDAALNVEDPKQRVSAIQAQGNAANLVVCPSLDAANISFNLLKEAADGLHIGPILLGTDLPAHVLTPSVTARGILNMTALAVVEAQRLAEARG